MLNDESNSFHLPSSTAALDLQLRFSHPMRSGFLSIIMPVYDDHDGLRITLDSLLTPNAPRDRFEIVVGNDGGDAAISKICAQYGVKEVIIRPNGGSYNARNRAIEQTCGEYIGLVDADETISPTWIEGVFTALKQVDFSGGPVELQVAPQPSPIEVYQMLYPPCEPRTQHDCPAAAVFPTANVALHRYVFEQVGGFDSRLHSGGDSEFFDRVTRANRYRQGFSEEMKVSHPCRTYNQIINRNRRIYYGQRNLMRLYPDRYQANRFPRGLTWRLLFPDMRCIRKNAFDLLNLKLDWGTYLRLVFLGWWMKIKRLEMLMSVQKDAKSAT